MVRIYDLIPTDVNGLADLLRLAEQVRDTGEPRVLEHDGEEIAVLLPVHVAKDLGFRRPRTRTDVADGLRAAGSWSEIDAEDFTEAIYASRGRPGYAEEAEQETLLDEPLTPEDIAAARSAAGSWEGHIDVEEFKRDNFKQRQVSTRPPVEL